MFFGLRGPVVDSIAVVMEVPIADGLRITKHAPVTHFLDLGGLVIRDLAHFGSDLLVPAGQVYTATINQSVSSCTFLLTGRIWSDSEGR